MCSYLLDFTRAHLSYMASYTGHSYKIKLSTMDMIFPFAFTFGTIIIYHCSFACYPYKLIINGLCYSYFIHIHFYHPAERRDMPQLLGVVQDMCFGAHWPDASDVCKMFPICTGIDPSPHSEMKLTSWNFVVALTACPASCCGFFYFQHMLSPLTKSAVDRAIRHCICWDASTRDSNSPQGKNGEKPC